MVDGEKPGVDSRDKAGSNDLPFGKCWYQEAVNSLRSRSKHKLKDLG